MCLFFLAPRFALEVGPWVASPGQQVLRVVADEKGVFHGHCPQNVNVGPTSTWKKYRQIDLNSMPLMIQLA